MPAISRRQFLAVSAIGSSAVMLGGCVAASPARSVGRRQSPAKLTMLNAMAGADVETQARHHVELGLKWLDLKDGMFGETINALSVENAREVAAIARDHGLGVFCLSTSICGSGLNVGEAAFRQRHNATLDHVLKIADILQPRHIRLISAQVDPFPGGDAVMDVVERDYPWVYRVYGAMIDRIAAAGCQPLIENETNKVIFARPEGILRFFARLPHPEKVKYTWDVQNLWQMGVFPTLDVYRKLKPIIGCIHLKGGRTEDGGRAPGPLVHASALEDASWAVADIMREAVSDGVAPFICLNPSHGKKPPGFNMWDVAQRDVVFLRKNVSADL